MTAWGDLNARARGLSSRLLDRDGIERLARAEPAEVAARLLDALPEGPVPGPPALERAIRRRAGAILAILARWAGDRRETLAVVLEEEDLRSARRLLRGAAAGAPPDRRLAGLVPTPTLPERALHGAAEAGTAGEALARLARAGHPDAAALADRAEAVAPDLFRLEADLARGFATRTTRAARRGGSALADHARLTVDLWNAGSALVAGGWRGEVEPDAVFVEGGEALDAERFGAIVDLPEPAALRRALAEAFAGTPLARPLADLSIPVAGLDAALLAARITALGRARRIDPLGPAPLLELALRLRAQVHDLQAIVRGAALGAPPAVVLARIATP